MMAMIMMGMVLLTVMILTVLKTLIVWNVSKEQSVGMMLIVFRAVLV